MNYNNCEFLASYGLSRQLPDSDRPEIVFSGRSNVGKSSLINKLCNRRKLARVSATPGKTATINFYKVDKAYFVDLPGYGYAKVSNAERERWDELINTYFEDDRSVCLLVQLLDSRHAPSADDVQMLEYLHYHRIPFVAALTKGSAPVHKITIVPRTSGALGYTMQVEEDERNLMTKEEAYAKIMTLTGGRCAEELIFDSITSGASRTE